MNTTTLVGVVVAIIVVIGGFFWYQSAQAPAPASTTASGTDAGQPDTGVSVSTGVTVTTAPMTAAVTYGPNGFSPASVTVAKGGTVTFTAAPGADEMWVASAPHPAHTGYDGTDRATHCAAGYTGAAPFDQCKAGGSFSFTFGKTGAWPYHNHGNAADHGTVVVQ